MNPRQRRLRRQRRKARVNDAEAAREELAEFKRRAAFLAAQAERKKEKEPTVGALIAKVFSDPLVG